MVGHEVELERTSGRDGDVRLPTEALMVLGLSSPANSTFPPGIVVIQLR